MNNLDNNAIELLESIFSYAKAKKLSAKLKNYNIITVEQLYGALNPILPDYSKSELKNKALFASYNTTKKQISTSKYKTDILINILKVSNTDAKKIEQKLLKQKFPLQDLKLDMSTWSMGLHESNKHHRSSFWSTAKFNNENERFVIPYYERMGIVFSQGRRGTCVANACCSLTDYLSNDKTSRQFLYHQCKMVDDTKQSEGTYIETAMKVLTTKWIVDYGVVKESDWKYNPNIGSTKHQGPPPEKCFNTTRYFDNQVVFVRQHSIVDDIKKLLVGSNMHKPSPVVIGVRLFASFQNRSSYRTGWITMPLPGETPTGGHAMLVVGYYEKDRVFLVRNSWGTGWASENKYGYQGHALIPYDYIKKHCSSAATLFSLDEENFSIPEKYRLYNNFHVLKQNNSLRAALSGESFTPLNHRRRKKKNWVISKLLWMALGSAITLFALYYEETIEFFEKVWKMF